jgi:hypothetical protein
VNKFKESLICAVYLTAIFSLVNLGLFLLKGRQTAEQVRVTAVELSTTVAKSNEALFKPYGLADEARKDLGDVHSAVGEAAAAERDYYQKILQPKSILLFNNLNDAIAGLNARRIGDDFHGSMVKLNTSLDEMPGVLQAAKETLNSTTQTMAALNRAISDVDKNLLNDPDIAKSLKEISEILGNVKLTTDEVLPIVQKIRHLATDPPSKKSKLLGILQFVYETVLIKAALGK